MQKIFLTLFYSGLLKYAPGTMGSIVALLIAMGILQFLSISNLFAFSVIIFSISVQEINKYEKINKTHDSKEIVIDELVGMWIALIVCNVNGDDYLKAFLAFLAFRYFDIFKPSIIGKIDKNVKGGLGVMGDDVVAGFFGGILVNVGYLAYDKLLPLIQNV